MLGGYPPQGTGGGNGSDRDWRDYLLQGIAAIASLIAVIFASVQNLITAFYASLVILGLLILILAWPKLRSLANTIRSRKRQKGFVSENEQEFRDLVDDFNQYASREYYDITTPIFEVLRGLDDGNPDRDPRNLWDLYRVYSGFVEHVNLDRENFPYLLKLFLEIVEYHNKVFVHEPLKMIRREDPSIRDTRQQEYEEYHRRYLRLMERVEKLADRADEIFPRVHFHYEHPPSTLTPQGD